MSVKIDMVLLLIHHLMAMARLHLLTITFFLLTFSLVTTLAASYQENTGFNASIFNINPIINTHYEAQYSDNDHLVQLPQYTFKVYLSIFTPSPDPYCQVTPSLLSS